MVVHDICSTMPRFTASSTKAARVQCDQCAGGDSHAKAIIWQTCSDVKVGAIPSRGASANRNSIASRNALGFLHTLQVMQRLTANAFATTCIFFLNR